MTLTIDACDDSTSGHIFESATAARRYVLAGNATMTLRSHKTGAHYTYRVRAKDGERLWFVSLLTGGDQYRYLGVIRPRGSSLAFGTTAKSIVSAESPAALGFARFWRAIDERDLLLPGLDVMHEGECGRCGRPLTNPESIESGLGPVCAVLILGEGEN